MRRGWRRLNPNKAGNSCEIIKTYHDDLGRNDRYCHYRFV